MEEESPTMEPRMPKKPTQDLHLDFETYCDLDLRKVGVHQYVNHASFRVLAVAWKINSRSTQRAFGSSLGGLPPDLRQALQSPDVQGHGLRMQGSVGIAR